MAYKSAKDNRYVNYALFNFEKDIDIEVIKVFKDSDIERSQMEQILYEIERYRRIK